MRGGCGTRRIESMAVVCWPQLYQKPTSSGMVCADGDLRGTAAKLKNRTRLKGSKALLARCQIARLQYVLPVATLDAIAVESVQD